MQITINELLKGNATIIKNKEYFSAAEYVQPFIDLMAPITNDYRVKVKLADQLSISDSKNIVYNRVLIEAVLPTTNVIDNHEEVIGFLYGLDIRKPIAKIYRAYINQACTNLSVFDPTWITYQEVKAESELKYEVKDLLSMANSFGKKITEMKSEFIPAEERNEYLGKWINFALAESHFNGIHSTKLSPNVVIDAYKSVYLDAESSYFVDSEVEESSVFNIYNAMTQILTNDKKDIMNDFEKTIMIGQMLGVVN